MVWLTGGMFAIACTMIFALLGLILYKGLATHWQRTFAIYPLNNGEFEAGEVQYSQPFNISRQSVGLLDELTRAKAEEILAGRDQAGSTQLYLRTGNYDLSNRHFAFVLHIAMNIQPADLDSGKTYKPRDLWLLERREWGVLYGFPCRLEQTFAPELDSGFANLRVLIDNLDTSLTIEASSVNAKLSPELAKEFSALLDSVATELKSNWEKSFPGGKSSGDSVHTTVNVSTLKSAVEESHRKQSKLLGKIEVAKQTLGRFDRQLSTSRIGVRKAEIRDGTDLQSIADEATQTATAKSISEASWLDLQSSIKAWTTKFVGQSGQLTQLGQIELAAKRRYDEELAPLSSTLSDIRGRLQTLPTTSKQSIETVIKVAESVSRLQYGLNLEIARLEAGLKAEVLTMQIPSLDSLGAVPWNGIKIASTIGDSFPKESSSVNHGSELSKIIGLDETVATATSTGEQVQLSPTQSMLTIDLPTGTKRFWLADEIENKQTRVSALRDKTVLVSEIVRVVEPNRLGMFGRTRLYAIRWSEFLFGQPREGGIEGGFFPALWGTIVMTLIMSIAVMPFGVIAALYMREYAKTGLVLSVIRISINNLAGVPSIVYGVFGLSFFCYTIGGFIDGGPIKAGFTPWPSSLWFVTLAVTALAGTGAFFLATLASGSPAQMSPLRKRLASFGGVFWLFCLIGIVSLVVKSPFFNGFYQATLPNPTFGKGCLLWASCTLALLTLPVVIVATEEALAAVPNSLREGSYACGAGKWQTLQRIVLPYARPGIITGFILAMARGAGEVAPMMLVGAIPLVTELPLDFEFPFFHGSRSFMHLGFQIYSLGFQSQNSEAAKPMVFTATLLLLTIVTLLNVTAIWLRARLRKRFQGSQF